MYCTVAKWLVSRRADTGKPVPAWTERHLLRCSSCLAFERFTSSLPEKTAVVASDENRDDVLSARILAALLSADSPKPAQAPRRRRVLVPAMTAGMVVLVAGVAVLWMSRPAPTPSLSEMLDLGRFGVLREEVISLDSPLRQELAGLEQKMDDALKFLIASLDPGLGD